MYSTAVSPRYCGNVADDRPSNVSEEHGLLGDSLMGWHQDDSTDGDVERQLRQKAADLQSEVANPHEKLDTARSRPGNPESTVQQVQAAAQHAREHRVEVAGPTGAAVRSQALQVSDTATGSSRTLLIRREERLRAIVESAMDHAIITADLEGRITGWNSGATRLLGWQEADVLGRPLRLIFTPEDCAAGLPEAETQRALEEGRAVDERWLIRRDGTRFFAIGELMPLHDGELLGYLKILRDRTEQRRAEEALRESEERYRLIVESARDYAIFTTDLEGRITTWNRGAREVLGWDEADAIGRPNSILHARGPFGRHTRSRDGGGAGQGTRGARPLASARGWPAHLGHRGRDPAAGQQRRDPWVSQNPARPHGPEA